MTTGRKNVMLGTAGHVDHGKTALVKLLTGCDTDRLAVEKQRGLTIELGFAPCRMADERIVGIIDVPGHVDFIRNMAAGAHGIDVVVLVVAADDGVMPQTREHLDILTLMGVRNGLVAVTKIDLVDPELRGLVAEEIGEFVQGTFLEGAAVCPISNVTGEGFDGFFAALNAAVDACEAREQVGAFRLWIERRFQIRGFGTVVSGIPSSGEVRVGDRLRLLPDGATGRVRGMEVYGEDAEIGRAGECVAVNVADIDADLLDRGKVLCEPGTCKPVTMVEADLRLLDSVPQSLRDYAEVHVHIGTAEVMANVAMLEGQQLLPGRPQLVQLRLREPVGVAVGERFVVRASVAGLAGGRVTTVGGGRILGTSNVRLRRRRPWTLQMLAERRGALDSPRAWSALCLKEAGRPLPAAELARQARVPPAQLAPLLDELKAAGDVIEIASSDLLHRDVLARMRERVLAAVSEFHDANPMRLGIEPAQLASQIGTDARLMAATVESLLADGELQHHGEVLGVPGRAASMSPEDRQLFERIEAALAEARLEPPLPESLTGRLGEPMERIEEMLRLLVDAGTVVRLDRKVAMHRDAVAAARQVLLELFAKANSFETVQFRDALGVSRKYAVPLLDYFDTVKLTVRSGNRRRPGAEARRLLEERSAP
jgi:selenocysteine-specific elongation factor